MPPYRFALLNIITLVFINVTWAQNASQTMPQESLDVSGDVTLADCLRLVLTHNPELAIYAWEPRMAEARTIQAGLRPNPELTFEIEDIGIGSLGGESGSSSSLSLSPTPALGFGLERYRTSNSSSGFDSAEITLSLSQLIELGGKRMKRVRLARAEEQVVNMGYEVLRAEILTSTAKAYYEVLLLQDRLEMATSFAQFAEEAHNITVARVQAGKISPLEETRSEVELQRIQLDTEHAEHELKSARIRLSAHWGSTTPQFDRALGTLRISARPESAESFLSRVDRSPDVQRWGAERTRRESDLNLERAQRKPDITVTAGVRSTGTGGRARTSGFGLSSIDGVNFSRGSVGSFDDREQSFQVGFTVPLPFFNRNQGRIREAELALEQLADEERALQTQLRAVVNAEWQSLIATYDESKTLEDSILPKAQLAFEATQEGYRQGKFGLLDVLLSQRTLFDTKNELLETLARHYRAKVEVERYTGQSVNVEVDEASPIEGATR